VPNPVLNKSPCSKKLVFESCSSRILAVALVLMLWGMSLPSHRDTKAHNQLCFQLDDARHPPFAGMALGILDQEGEASH
jgi:hypothetical protein